MANPEEILSHQSGVNKKGEPFVQLLRGGKVIGQMDPHEARDHARAMMEAAEAAEQDAFIFDWVTKQVGSGPAQAMGILIGFRKYREERTGKRGGPTSREEWVMPDNAPKPEGGAGE